MHMMSRQDRSAVAAAHETIGLLRRVRSLAVQQTPARDSLPIPGGGQLRRPLIRSRAYPPVWRRILPERTHCEPGERLSGPARRHRVLPFTWWMTWPATMVRPARSLGICRERESV
jgi:hypothetical protein